MEQSIEKGDFIYDKIFLYEDERSDLKSFLEYTKGELEALDRGSHTYEVIQKGYTKATACRFIMEKFGINPKNAYVFGDSTNDIAMFEHVPNAVLMGRHSPELEPYASFLTKTVEQDGIWYAMENGFANDMSAATFLPELTNTNALGYLSIIIFNFMGFEVICTMTDDMADPARDIPKAIIVGGLSIAVIYLFAGFGIGAAVPADSIDPDYGMIVAVQTMVGDSMIFKVICIAFLITLFANMAAWSFGVNSVARYAAEHGNMPKVFASMISDDDMPNGANLVNAIVASLVLCLQLVPIDAISNGVFWMLFGTSVVFLLLTYIPMFPAFLNLRKNDPNRERIFTFPFKGAMMKVMLAIPCIELILAIVATLAPFSVDEIADKVPMIVIFIVLMLIGEIVRVVSAKGRETEYKGLTPELAAQRLAEEAAEAEEN